ncbi:hypothetical protein RHSIM_Rhsim01G0136300 [Rhododendron simsii]|uniref:DNA-directed DNA polymerase n=1 Tax=Rhododendron simsii TaxID=118357 RepID=A0A834LX91_RHOSS|nr:hypothetical protein RHSIM_Rhsim01G0136300 [Rhododendron simsii]
MLTGYQRLKQKRMEQNLVELKAAGIKNVPKSLFGLNQSGNGKSDDKEKNDIGCRAIDGDEHCVLFDGEERLSSNSDSDDPMGSKANKVKGTGLRKEKGCSSAQPLRKSQRTQEGGGSPQGATQTQQLPTSPTEQTNMFCSPHTVIGYAETPAIPSQASQNLKRKRGLTKLKTIAVDGSSRIEVEFDENGQPIGDGSIKLSSFLGPLVREIVPYTLSDWRKLPKGMAESYGNALRFNLHEEWHRQMVFRRMNEDWRASKSILVKKIRNASNEEERLKLQPDNVKSLHDWKDFVKEKTSEQFKVTSENFKDMRRKQLEMQHTMSRKGYARLTAELKDMGKIERNGQNSTNLKEDAVSKVLGAERRGRLRTFGKGVTLTKLTILSQMNGRFAQLHEENAQMKSQMSHMQNTFDELKKSQVQNPATTQATPSTPIISPSVRGKEIWHSELIFGDMLSDNYYIVAYHSNTGTGSDYWNPSKNFAVQLAAAITASARIYMYPYISREDYHYMDTDSVVLGQPLLEEVISSSVLGKH